MRYILITKKEQVFQKCLPHGEIYVMIDLETLGKKERQPGFENFISDHSKTDLDVATEILPLERLIVRCNPPHPGSATEINSILGRKVGGLMLPMFQSVYEVQRIVDIVNGRARIFFLVETPAAVLRLTQITAVVPKDSVFHIGLNDLRLALGLNHVFEVLSSGFVGFALEKLRGLGFEYGFGGVGLSKGDPVPSDLILSSHKSYGSSWVILSRSFQEAAVNNFDETFYQVKALHVMAASFTGPKVKILEQKVQQCIDKTI